ncbi:MAG: single-stranded DNA-binding protein [Firmicutes bacterium]|nr:single-stranded DNA-binding protein [Bacillota bacterium]
MNQVQLVGRLSRDPQVSYSASTQNAVARFTVAVDRMPDRNGNRQADFISCVSFGKTAEFIEKYFTKGKPIALTGRIQTGSYEKNGQKVYTTDVVADRVEFVPGGNGDGQTGGQSAPQGISKSGSDDKPSGGFDEIPDLIPDDDIPF